ncbi:MAG: hypothetical protein DI535_15300 [Citrobacter freundii]|nr:MAG: hypothetical protein DI535_15300 [Citrobacter freundii]
MCHPPGLDVKIKPGNYVFKYHAAGKRLPIGAKNTFLTFSTPPKRGSGHKQGIKNRNSCRFCKGKRANIFGMGEVKVQEVPEVPEVPEVS